MELWDICDREGGHTGRRIKRGSEFAPGEFHLAVHVWIVNERGEYLIQRRALHLDSATGTWSTTAGCVVAGEESEAAVVREVREELGVILSPNQLTLIDRIVNRHHLEDVWLATVAVNELGAVDLGEEVMEVRWVSPAELEKMLAKGAFFPYSYVRELLAGPVPRQLSAPA